MAREDAKVRRMNDRGVVMSGAVLRYAQSEYAGVDRAGLAFSLPSYSSVCAE